MTSPRSLARCAAAATCLVLGASSTAHAQSTVGPLAAPSPGAPAQPPPPAAPSPPSTLAPVRRFERPPDWKWTGFLDVTSFSSFLLFAGGALTGLAAHELGHIFTNLAYGNVPSFKGILYGKFIPYFVIAPDLTERNGVWYKRNGSVFAGGKQGYYVINTAGLNVQNLGSEIILSLRPGLLYERAPYVKGVLWMNMLLSLGYGTASLIGTEPPTGDLAGAADHSQYPRGFIAGLVITNGALDMLRYFFPNNDWLPWVSRTSKAMLFGMDIPFK